MGTDSIVDCLRGLSAELDARGVKPGSITHTIAQLESAFRQEADGIGFSLEKHIETAVRSSTGKIDVDRFVDVVSTRLIEGVKTTIHTEIKTGKLGSALDTTQLTEDAALAIQKAIRSRGHEILENVWEFAGVNSFTPKMEEAIRAKLEKVRENLFEEGFSDGRIRTALESFHFVDKLGRALNVKIGENGEIIFEKSAEALLGPDGKVAQVFEKHAKGSPNFNPAMEALLGPTGKMAHAATEAAGATNLDPALKGLEKKLEDGVGKVMDEAGNAVQKMGAKELMGKIGSGIGALGSAISSIPQMYQSIKTLGEAWDKPLKSTEDYMNLMSAVGGVVSQAGGVIQAFAGLTELASAAQAVFNAVMAMNPIVLVVIAVVALIAAIVLLIVYWDKVKAAIRDNPWIAVIAVMFGVIGIIIVVIAYWDEIKLAVLKAANFISIQVQKIGQFFVGMGNLIGQVWNWITASVENVGIAIINTFITMGANVSNFFIGFVNGIIDMINTVGDALGLGTISKIPEVNVQANLIPPKEVPKIDVDAAFRPAGEIKGGLEDQIAKQEGVVAKAREEDEARRKAKNQPAPGAPGAPGAAPGAVPGAPAVPPIGPPAPGAVVPPALPGGLGAPAAAAAAAGPSNTTVNLGGITVTINADRLEANASQMLSDEIVSALSERLSALLATQNFRTGERPA